MNSSSNNLRLVDFAAISIRIELFDDQGGKCSAFVPGAFVNAIADGPTSGFEVTLKKDEFEVSFSGDGFTFFRFQVPQDVRLENFEIEFLDFRSGRKWKNFRAA